MEHDPNIDWSIYYFSHQYFTEAHLAHTIIPKLGSRFFNIDCGKFDRKNLNITLLGIPKIIRAFFTSLKLISQIQPNIIISFGGYVSVPVILAAFFKRVPSITHEQTLTNSLATRINSQFVTKVALSFDNQSQINQLPPSKIVVTGNLIRQEIFNKNSPLFKNLKNKNFPLIYITGGNQGSIFLNNLVYQLLPSLTKKFIIVHQTGKNNPASISTNYFPMEFIGKEDIGFILNHSSLVISRSGANICQELDILDKKSILIPLPFTQQNEQPKNAAWLKLRHPQTTVVLNQEKTTIKNLSAAIKRLSENEHVSYPTKPISPHPLTKLINEIAN